MEKKNVGGVIVQVSRLPKNIGEAMNKLIAGEFIDVHVIAVTKDGRVVSTSTKGVPDLIRAHDRL